MKCVGAVGKSDEHLNSVTQAAGAGAGGYGYHSKIRITLKLNLTTDLNVNGASPDANAGCTIAPLLQP